MTAKPIWIHRCDGNDKMNSETEFHKKYPFYLSWTEILRTGVCAGLSVTKTFGVLDNEHTQKVIEHLKSDPRASDIRLMPTKE